MKLMKFKIDLVLILMFLQANNCLMISMFSFSIATYKGVFSLKIFYFEISFKMMILNCI